eukprot:5617-Eustigmatos_ZCMA.PRE.1
MNHGVRGTQLSRALRVSERHGELACRWGEGRVYFVCGSCCPWSVLKRLLMTKQHSGSDEY